jgi:hypothetical protein
MGTTVLKAFKVDLSKTGDSILTDIVDGIAHSQLVLADISSVGKDSVTGNAYRNGNVMYEVGIALACRQPAEVLLIRDDNDRFLFDISTIPHMKLDFADKAAAIESLRIALQERLREQKYLYDARVQIALATLNQGEVQILKERADSPIGAVFSPTNQGGFVVGGIEVNQLSYITRLLDKQLIVLVGARPDGTPSYRLTSFGFVVAHVVKANFPQA